MAVRFRRCLPVLIAVVLGATGCSPLVDVEQTAAEVRSSVQAPTVRGGEAVIALDQEPDKLDPTLASTLASRQIFISMCEKLYDVDASVHIVPQLAAALPQVSPDGLEMTIPLREGVLFNDGTPFDAPAVKKSMDRHRELNGSSRKTELSAVRSVSVLDPHTVRLTLSRPYAPLTSMLADRAGMVMSPAKLDELGEDFTNDPVCVGPFKFVERVAQDRIVLDRSEFYYDRDKVKLDRLIYRTVPDDNIRMANLRSGEFDVIWEVPTPEVPILVRDREITLLNQPTLQYYAITPNIQNVGGETGEVTGPLADDPRVREALSLAIDRGTLNKIAFNGLYQPACGPIPDSSEYATPKTQECGPYDPNRARQLLAEAGVRTPVRFEMTLANDPTQMRAGQIIQAMAAEAGFDIVLRPTESTTAIAEARDGQFQSYFGGWSGRPDPDGNIASFHVQGSSSNYSGYYTPELDDLIKRAAAELDVPRRRALYEQVVDELHRRNSVIYLYRTQYYVAHTAELAGVEIYPDGIIRMNTAGYVQAGG
ncbi:ABC transporter substrate-binding protein [Saccharopolyspora soli]|uniref:ABC transporter substrate-binding protein n=1 Tax=Saccharopolyspora soli TaxID=2926618 RepID=UPI001F579515|nr:ABC transporter substrate-binding protein [Saccharopolyspora soli]